MTAQLASTFAGESWCVAVTADDIWRLSWSELQEALRSKVIDEFTFVWQDGMEDWLPLKDVLQQRQASTAPVGAVARAESIPAEPPPASPLRAVPSPAEPAAAVPAVFTLAELELDSEPEPPPVTRLGLGPDLVLTEPASSEPAQGSPPSVVPAAPPKEERAKARVAPTPLRHLTRLVRPRTLAELAAAAAKRPNLAKAQSGVRTSLKAELPSEPKQEPTKKPELELRVARRAVIPPPLPPEPAAVSEVLEAPPAERESSPVVTRPIRTVLPPPLPAESVPTDTGNPLAPAPLSSPPSLPTPSEGLLHVLGKGPAPEPRRTPLPPEGASLAPLAVSRPPAPMPAKRQRSHNERWLLAVPIVAGLLVAFDVNGTWHRLFRSEPAASGPAAEAEARAKKPRKAAAESPKPSRPEGVSIPAVIVQNPTANGPAAHEPPRPNPASKPAAAPAPKPPAAAAAAPPAPTPAPKPRKPKPAQDTDLGMTGEAMDELAPTGEGSEGASPEPTRSKSRAAEAPSKEKAAVRTPDSAPAAPEPWESKPSAEAPTPSKPSAPAKPKLPPPRQGDEFDPLNPEL